MVSEQGLKQENVKGMISCKQSHFHIKQELQRKDDMQAFTNYKPDEKPNYYC